MGKCTPSSNDNCRLPLPPGMTFERRGLVYSSGLCEKEAKSSKRPRTSSLLLFTGEGWEFSDRNGARGCSPAGVPHTQRTFPAETQRLKDPRKASPSNPPLSKQEGRRNWGTGFTCQGERGTAQRKLLTARRLFREMLARSQAALASQSVSEEFSTHTRMRTV